MPEQITSATVVVNDEVVGIVPNSLTYNEGLGEQMVRPVSVGGGRTEQLFSQNIESNFGKVKFDIHCTIDNVKLARRWKTNKSSNVVQLFAETDDGDFARTFTQAAIINDYEVTIATEGNISIEWHTNPAI